VNGSQLKFFIGTWHISLNQSDVALFYHIQYHIAIENLSVLGTGLETAAEIQISVSKNTSDIDDKNRTKTQFMCSQSFHRPVDGRVQETTMKVQFILRNLESFDLMNQELYRFHPVIIHT
jgi:hypothetical protein